MVKPEEKALENRETVRQQEAPHINLKDVEKHLALPRNTLNRYIRKLGIPVYPGGRYKSIAPSDVEAIRRYKERIASEKLGLAATPDQIPVRTAASTLDISDSLLRYHLKKLGITPHQREGNRKTFITPDEFEMARRSLKQAQELDTAQRSAWHQKDYRSERTHEQRYSGKRKRTPEEMELARRYQAEEPVPLENWVSREEAAFCMTVRANIQREQPPYQYVSPFSVNQLREIGKLDPTFIARLSQKMFVFNKIYIMHDAPLPQQIATSQDLTPEHIAEWIREYPRMLREMQALGWRIPYLQEAQAINSQQRAIS